MSDTENTTAKFELIFSFKKVLCCFAFDSDINHANNHHQPIVVNSSEIAYVLSALRYYGHDICISDPPQRTILLHKPAEVLKGMPLTLTCQVDDPGYPPVNKVRKHEPRFELANFRPVD